MKEYLKSLQEIIDEVKTSENGLSQEEAATRLEKNGKNKLDEGKKESLIHKFFMELKDPMIIILIVAALSLIHICPFKANSPFFIKMISLI